MHGVDYIFHAAALKQVPSGEFFPVEAVKTNILGAENVLNAAISQNVSKVIVLSTDKAVYPINAMGMSKALMEKVMTAKSRTVDGKKPDFSSFCLNTNSAEHLWALPQQGLDIIIKKGYYLAGK